MADADTSAELGAATERFLIDAMPDVGQMHVCDSGVSDSVIIVDDVTGDDVAEVFHCGMHSVSQEADQARAIGTLFAAAPKLLAALVGLIRVRPINFDDGEDPQLSAAYREAFAAVVASVPAA